MLSQLLHDVKKKDRIFQLHQIVIYGENWGFGIKSECLDLDAAIPNIPFVSLPNSDSEYRYELQNGESIRQRRFISAKTNDFCPLQSHHIRISNSQKDASLSLRVKRK